MTPSYALKTSFVSERLPLPFAFVEKQVECIKRLE
jgi:hypothetical protein